MSLKKEGSSSSQEAPRVEVERKERPSKAPAATAEKAEKQQKSAAPKTKNLFQLELEKYAARKKGDDDSDKE